MLNTTDNFLSFQFSLFLDDHTCKLRAKRRFSENLTEEETKKQVKLSPLKKKREKTCSIETRDSKKSNFSLANFYPRFQRYTSNEELFSFTTFNSFSEENHATEKLCVENVIKKKLCLKIKRKLLDILKKKISS